LEQEKFCYDKNMIKIQSNFPLAQVTTFGLGGPAKFYLKTSSPEEAVAGVLTAQERKLKYLVLGGGSNAIFRDEGFAGLVIHFTGAKLTPENFATGLGGRVVVSASANWHEVVKKLAELGLSGLERMSAIPGNVGGAVVGNAGAYNQYLGDKVEWVEIFDGKIIRRLSQADCHFGYRDSIFKKKDWLVLRVCLKLKKGEPQKLLKEVNEIAKARWQKFGRHPACAGSFFKNVEVRKVSKKILAKIDPTKIIEGKISVGYLIGEAFGVSPEASPLKASQGLASGRPSGIHIAPFHNNFLMNDGTGTTRDLLRLAIKIKTAVQKKFGIELEEEVRYIL